MACKIRLNITKYKLPLNHRWLNKSWYLNQTLYKAWRYHLYAHNLQVEDVVFRRIIYDAIYDSLRNEYDKIRHKDFLNEYAKFQQYWNEHFSDLNEKIADWENYRQSGKYQYFLEQLKHIKRFDRRVQTSIDHALAFMYAKYQKGFVVAETLEQIEKRLKLDVIPRVWSKKWLWFAVTVLIFDANDLYASTLGRSKFVVYEWDKLSGEAVKIHIQRWYERKDLALSGYEKMLCRTYENIIVPLAGEVGSVALAEVARRGTCIALIHAARMLTNFAKFHPTLRYLSWGAELLGSLAQILNNSVLAWLGWQVKVEWSLDGTIQKFMNEALKYVYAGLTGKRVWKGRDYVDWGLLDLAAYYQFKKYADGKLDEDEQELVDFVYQYGSDKQKQILDRIARAVEVAQTLYAFKKFFYQTERKFLDEINYLLDKAIHRAEDFYYHQLHILDEQMLEGYIKQKIYELDKAKDENTLNLDWYKLDVSDKKFQFTDENGMKHSRYESNRNYTIFVPLSGCFSQEGWYICDLAYVEYLRFNSSLDIAEKEEYESEESKEFINSLLDKTKTILYWRYGIRKAVRQKDLLKLPLLFLSDLIRPRVTKNCISVIREGKRFYKYILDYDSKYNNKTLIYRYYYYKNYTDNYDNSYRFSQCGRDIKTNYIGCADVSWTADWNISYTSVNGARSGSRTHYILESDPSWELYIHTYHTTFSERKVAELKISFTDDAVIWEKRHNWEWKAGYLATYDALKYLLEHTPTQRYVLQLSWGTPSRTFKVISKRSKLVCY